ncbi:ABC transporter ATP-binding protein [Metamycoplasma neophronis]|uniref:ABC transporter ATP-binding protein n=1 Tax=Metamycoplasma neophronis TaxID=872983 RepID=A0ABY2Z5Z3_9BACT|nr:ABC transporter ATP-binding protein [Metamycoplasma neophronis]TPR54714.1 ABC transporter ATP-binding protein [Metamycoplasma neophronis]
MNKILEIKNLSKIYKKTNHGIKNATFDVNAGDFHAFIGENGAGKTTTIKSIIGSYYQYDGEILINGINSRDPKSKAIIGYVPEVAIFPEELTVHQYLKSLALLSNIDKSKCEDLIDFYLKKFNIEDLKNEKPHAFSSGQKKKVLLIQALLHDPQLIILDEPAANLDPTARYELFAILNELKNNGKTIFISSHVLSEIDKYVDSFTLINKGKVIYSGKKDGSLEKIYYEKVIQN